MSSWNLDLFDGKDVVFVGAGKGRAMAGIKKFLAKHSKMASFDGVDKQPEEYPLSFLSLYNQERTVFIKNEGIPGHEMPVPYITQLQLFFDLIPFKQSLTVGITGTKGKSTTTALTSHILKTAGKKVVLAGNIGISPFDALDDARSDTIFVLELSSYQLSDLKRSPHISACLNLYNDHTDWHGSLEAYWEAKHNIMRFAGANDIFIYNPDFETLREWAMSARCQTRPINPNELLDLSQAKLYGAHNNLNALVARQIARELGISDETSLQAINSFQPLEHRMEFVASKKDRIFINDAIGMTPESTIASAQAVAEKYGQLGCLLLGGQDRNYEFTSLMQFVAGQKVPSLVLFPDTAAKIKASLPAGYKPQILETTDMKHAVTWAAQAAPENSVVLLSTAAPSYSLWSDFEEKGSLFKKAVGKL